MINEFYPITSWYSLESGEFSWTVKVQVHLENAKNGDKVAESNLCNCLGQLRRSVEDMSTISSNVMDVVKEGVAYLRSVGRVVDFGNEDPRYWITRRGGGPRW